MAVIPLGYGKSEAVSAAADKLYAELAAAGVDAFLDDRDERPGVLLADQELVGIPHRIVIGERGLKEGMVEYQHRRDAQATKVPLARPRTTSSNASPMRGRRLAASAAVSLAALLGGEAAFGGAVAEKLGFVRDGMVELMG